MRYLTVGIIAFLAIVGADEEWKPVSDVDNVKIHETCLKESPLSDEQLKQMRNTEFPDETEAHEHVLCLVTKAGIFTEEHGFYADRIVAQFAAMKVDTEKVRNIIANCVASSDPNNTPAIRAFRGLKCILSNKIEGLQKSGVNNA